MVAKKPVKKIYITLTSEPVADAAEKNLPAVELSVEVGKEYDFDKLIEQAARKLQQCLYAA